MNKPYQLLVLTLGLLCILSTCIWGQSPSLINYQAVVRDQAGAPLANQNTSFRLSILQGNISGTAVFSEVHTLVTNNLGLISLQIGNGTNLSGDISSISWENGPYFMKIEADITGGSTFILFGTTQLVSVPYALYSNVTDSLRGGVDRDSTNEFQVLSLVGDTVRLSNANEIVLYDHPIIMTGPNSLSRQIKNVGLPTDSSDAVNVKAHQNGQLVFGQAVGTGNNYEVNINPSLSSLTPGTLVFFIANHSNSGPSTLNLNGLGQQPLRKNGSAPLSPGDISSGKIIQAIFDGNVFQISAGGVSNSSQGNHCFTCDGFGRRVS